MWSDLKCLFGFHNLVKVPEGILCFWTCTRCGEQPYRWTR